MLRSFHERRKAEEGFTLIELMVVVLIIGILVAIALPTFLGARNRANDKAAQSGLRNAIAAAKTCFTDNDTYQDPDGVGAKVACINTTLDDIETALTFNATGAGSTGPNIISVGVSDVNPAAGDNWGAAAWSKSGTCFYIRDLAAGAAAGTRYGSAAVTLLAAPADCDADAALTAGTANLTSW